MFTIVGRDSAFEAEENMIGDGAPRYELCRLWKRSDTGEARAVPKLGRRLDGAEPGWRANGRWNFEWLIWDGTRPGLNGGCGLSGKSVLEKRSVE